MCIFTNTWLLSNFVATLQYLWCEHFCYCSHICCNAGLSFAYQLLYLLDATGFYTPALHILRVHVCRATGQELVINLPIFFPWIFWNGTTTFLLALELLFCCWMPIQQMTMLSYATLPDFWDPQSQLDLILWILYEMCVWTLMFFVYLTSRSWLQFDIKVDGYLF